MADSRSLFTDAHEDRDLRLVTHEEEAGMDLKDALLQLDIHLDRHRDGEQVLVQRDALTTVLDAFNVLREQKHYVVLVADDDNPTGDVIGTFSSLEDAQTWAMAQPGGERYWQCSVRKPA